MTDATALSGSGPGRGGGSAAAALVAGSTFATVTASGCSGAGSGRPADCGGGGEGAVSLSSKCRKGDYAKEGSIPFGEDMPLSVHGQDTIRQPTRRPGMGEAGPLVFPAMLPMHVDSILI